jgi:ribonuclease J
MSEINFFALGGQDEKGKNCYILKQNKNLFMIDAGVKNPIVAKLGIDTIIPNFNHIKLHANNFQGIFITSGHDDSIGALP